VIRNLPGPVASPSQIAADRELLLAARRLLSEEERQVADRRAQGYEWRDIAAELGASPEALRKRLSRAMDRVCGALGLDEVHDG
jgi:DNA-directed RNA polymerase specialized sigma24 family protein